MLKIMENKEDDIEVNKISRGQMRTGLKAKEKNLKLLTRKIYVKFYHR